MAQDLSAKKSNFASEAVGLAAQILQVARLCDELDAAFFANAFNTGAANQFVQNDFTGGNAHLTPTILTNVLSAVEAIKTAASQGVRDNLRQALVDPFAT